MKPPQIVGLIPWLPWPLAGSRWWTRPVRAERLAAFRIGVAAVLLFDILGTYLPQVGDFFGSNSLGSPEVFAPTRASVPRCTVLGAVTDAATFRGLLLLWAAAAGLLLLGLLPRASAAAAWLFSISFIGVNFYLGNSGDNVRSIELFYLMLSPCAAVWALGRRRTNAGGGSGRVYVPAWPLRLLLLQMALIYVVNGLYKLAGPGWRDGDVLHIVLGNLAWSRLPSARLPLPYALTQVMTWTVLGWELFFPILVAMRSTRTLALWLGVSFHVGTGLFLQLGPFPLYMLCLYLPFVPWERYVDRWRRGPA
jgi:hypothetical protein